MDHFARLGVPRAPWLDLDGLNARFLARSAEIHPDKTAGQKESAETEFAALNESFRVLGNARARILHLLELEGEPRPEHVQSIPAAVVDFFPAVAQLTQRADSLLKEKSLATSPMLKVQYLERALECVDALQQLETELQSCVAAIEAKLRIVASEYEQKRELASLREAAAALGFLERWRGQLQQRATALTF